MFPNGKGKGKDETTPGQLLLTHSPAVQATPPALGGTRVVIQRDPCRSVVPLSPSVSHGALFPDRAYWHPSLTGAAARGDAVNTLWSHRLINSATILLF